MEDYFEDYVRKVILLENTIGTSTSYHILEPFHFDQWNFIELHDAARKISEFINLHDITWIVSATGLKENVGGQIELRKGDNEVFIEISSNTMIFSKAVLATMAHEITHKFLEINHITCGEGLEYKYENEILTDIAAVFLGLGKLMLNGNECEDSKYAADGQKTIRTHLKTGYLDLQGLAFVYILICEMRGISQFTYKTGLSRDVIDALDNCYVKYANYWDENYPLSDVTVSLNKFLYSKVDEIQKGLALIDRDLLYIKKICIDSVEYFLDKTHKKLYESIIECKKILYDEQFDPCLSYLQIIRLRQLINAVNNYPSEIEKYSDAVSRLVVKIWKAYEEPSGIFDLPTSDISNKLIIICRNDGTKLKVPENRTNLIVKCPKCNYQFFINTITPNFKNRAMSQMITGSKPNAIKKWKATLFKKLFKR